jgi:integrase
LLTLRLRLTNCMSKTTLMIVKFSQPKVSPENWTNPRCSIKKNWYIQYRIYYPNDSKQVILKGMNKFKTWEERCKSTKNLLESEIQKLQNQMEQQHKVVDPKNVVNFSTVKDAMTSMVNKKRNNCVERHCANLQTMVERFISCSISLGYNFTFNNIRRGEVLNVLDHMYKQYPSFSDNTYNRYKKDLGTLFNDMIYYELCENNPFDQIRKKETNKNLKRIATKEEFNKIDRYLHKKHYYFWRFMQIFFYSGGRTTELCRMEMKDILIKYKEFRITIKKGRSCRQEIKAILPGSFKLWKELSEEAHDKKYPFGPSFKPDNQAIDASIVNKTWKRLVKDELRMGDIDFYSLKHLHTDLVAAKFGIETAQGLDDHKDAAVTSIYAVGEKKRQLEKLKQLDTGFNSSFEDV